MQHAKFEEDDYGGDDEGIDTDKEKKKNKCSINDNIPLTRSILVPSGNQIPSLHYQTRLAICLA